MHNTSSRRALVLLTSLLILAGMLHAQIIIKDTIQIKPNHLPLMATAAVAQPIRFELSWNGGLNGWVDVYLYEPCGGGDDYKGRWETNSQSLSFSAVGPQAGKYTVIANFFGAQSGITNLKLTVFDEGLPTKEIPFPIGSTFVEYNTPYYSGFRFYDNSNGRDEDIVYEDFTGMSLVNEYNCNGTRWMPSGNPLVTYTITQGSEYASLAEYFSRTIYGNAYTASYQDGAPIVVANGIRPAGNDGALVEVTAQSGDVIATRRFRVRPYYYRIVPESLTIKTGEETIIALSLVNWYGGEHNRGVAAATELILEDTADVGTLRFENEDGEIRQTSDTLANIDVPVSPYFRGSVKFIGNAIALTDTLSVKIKVRKSGEGNWIWIQRPRQAPYEGATATTGEGELRIVPGEVLPILSFVDHTIRSIWPYIPNQTDGTSRGANKSGYDPTMKKIRLKLTNPDNKPVVNKPIQINTSFTAGSGGHQHTGGTIEIPQSKQGLFYYEGRSGNPLKDLYTDGNGIVEIDSFTLAQVSGTYLFTAQSQENDMIFDTLTILIKVPGLVNLRNKIIQPAIWTFYSGTTDKHPEFTWVTETAAEKFFMAVLDFYEWSLTQGGGNVERILSINDISLPAGGVFDIDGRWNLTKRHSLHRVGESIDINDGHGFKMIDPTDPKKKRKIWTDLGKKLREFIKMRDGVPYEESSIHFGFNGSH